MPKSPTQKKPKNTKYQQRLARARMLGAEAVLIALEESWRNAYGATQEGALVFQRLVRPAQKEMAKLDYAYKVLLGELSEAEAKRLLAMP